MVRKGCHVFSRAQVSENFNIPCAGLSSLQRRRRNAQLAKSQRTLIVMKIFKFIAYRMIQRVGGIGRTVRFVHHNMDSLADGANGAVPRNTLGLSTVRKKHLSAIKVKTIVGKIIFGLFATASFFLRLILAPLVGSIELYVWCGGRVNPPDGLGASGTESHGIKITRLNSRFAHLIQPGSTPSSPQSPSIQICKL
jgi:hypothetical protein